ncbi:GumC family protein [Ollibium composti]|uniref:Succinoglycan biosynthesis protein exop n=1 Tax=Ollibium composti TaxID=2675109 RepID=A0ABY2QBN2_9HYPH|nr:hypothetical protein [Mesorhizobium composti]THF58971.1 hypothetical protein E6C48_04800 [Mesorhizobium composti]
MRNSQNRHDWRHEPSLPAFGAAPHANDDAPGSLLGVAGSALPPRFDDAAIRHRLARLARETREANEAFFSGAAEDRHPDDEAWAEDFQNKFLPTNDDPPAGTESRVMPAASGMARSKRLIAACGLLGAMAGGLTALSLPARYEATAELHLAAGADVSTFAGLQDQRRVVTSGIVLNKVVDKLGLADDPAFNGTETDSGFVSLLRSLLSRSDGAAASDAGHRHAMAASRLADSISVSQGRGASTIAVTAATGNGETSALIANTVAEAFLATVTTMHSAPQDSGTAGKVDEAAKKLEVFLAQHGLGSGDANAAADALLKLDDQLSAARARTAELNGKIAAMKAVGVDAAMGGGLPQEFESNAMAALRSQYLAIKRESDRAEAQLGPRNPERIALDTQLAGARDRIAAELRRITASLQATLKEAVQAEQGLAARRAQSGLDANGIATLRTLRDAARQAAAEARPNRSDDLRDATSGASVVTKAYAPLEPSGPSRLPVTLAGLLAGLAAGAGIGAVRGRRRTRADGNDENTGLAAQAASGSGENPAAPAPAIENLISAVRRASPAQEPIDAGGAELMPTETAETPYPLEDTMYPVYADQMHAFAPRQPGDAPQQPFQPPVYAAPHPYGTQPAMPQMVQPYVYTPYAPAYLWQPQPPMPIQAGFYPYPQPAQSMSGYPQPARPETTTAADQASLEEIRASLREFREAVRELAESRTRRRYF